MKQNLPFVVMDVDNTLVPSGKQISNENKEAISLYLKQGGKIMLATGKVPSALYELIRILNIEDNYHIAGNGSFLFHMNKNEFQELFKLGNNSKMIIQSLIENKISAYVYYADTINIIGRGHTKKEIEHMISLGEPTPMVNEEINYEEVVKILFFIDNDDFEKEKLIRELLEPYMGDYHFIRTGSYLLEIHHQEQTKANALKKYTELFPAELENFYAIGDSENDLSMLEVVGNPYIVGNASEELKRRFKNMLPSCEDNGVSILLKRLMNL